LPRIPPPTMPTMPSGICTWAGGVGATSRGRTDNSDELVGQLLGVQKFNYDKLLASITSVAHNPQIAAAMMEPKVAPSIPSGINTWDGPAPYLEGLSPIAGVASPQRRASEFFPGSPSRKYSEAAVVASISGASVCEEPAPAIVPSSSSAGGGLMSGVWRPVDVTLHVYYQRAVDLDERGRMQRGANSLTWFSALGKDILGVYHVGVAVRGVEYVCGNYRGKNSRRVGHLVDSGICAHEPRMAGPANVFKQAVPLGQTQYTAEQVEEIAVELANTRYFARAYSRYNLNCVDFAQEFRKRLGAEALPAWCSRGLDMARLLGMGKAENIEDGGSPFRATSVDSIAAVRMGEMPIRTITQEL